MKKNEIKVGACYHAKVGAKVTVVRVDAIRETVTGNGMRGLKNGVAFDVTNLATGRRTTFRSAMKFREEVQAPVSKEDEQSADPTIPSSTTPTTTFSSEPSSAKSCSTSLPLGSSSATSTSTISSAGATSANGQLPCATPAQVTTQPKTAPNGDTPFASILRKAVNGGNDKAPHLIVEARAGTGKTTTLVTALQVLKGIKPTITPSPQQQAVWDAVAMSRDARSVCFVAFNKSIAEELQRRVPSGCDACTMHSMGYRAVRRAFGNVQANDWAVKDIIAEVMNSDLKTLRKDKPVLVNAVEKLTSLCKGNLINMEDIGEEALDAIAFHYDVDLDKYKREVFQLVPQVLDRCRNPKGKIAFDDMIWLPVVHGLPVYTYDLLLVDEAQDLNRCQQALAKMAGRRLILCGDPKQAIYGFAGADSESMPRMARELNDGEMPPAKKADPNHRGCDILPLTVTRRCGKAIVAEANRYVPDFEAHESNPEGTVSSAKYPGKRKGQNGDGVEIPWEASYGPLVRGGDMVLCRCNAPLVSQCFAFIRRGIKANIRGRDIGTGLISTVKKMEAASVPDLVAKLTEWHGKEVAKEEAKKHPSANRISALDDRLECLLCFTEGVQLRVVPAGLTVPGFSVEMDGPGGVALRLATFATREEAEEAKGGLEVQAVINKIESIFTDASTDGVRLSSIHKAKGLEADRVFILRPPGVGPREDKMRGWELEQEDNIRYVAITRAIRELIYVS